MRAQWARTGLGLTVACPRSGVQTELVCGRQVLWSGRWDVEVLRGGQRIEPDGPWQETCRLSDKSVDYLELQLGCRGGIRVDRHILLAKRDRFLFLADAVLGRRRAELHYRASLALGERAFFQGAKQTREGFLTVGRARALVLPLALPEWRSRRQGGTLKETERRLELTQRAEGSCLLAPLFVDLKPRRFAQPLTWRQLTVAENLSVQGPDAAVGYRVLVGRGQWLIYRALACKGNRTLLGHNLSTEFLVARFLRDGRVEPLVEIE
jgi:hypothetical protein